MSCGRRRALWGLAFLVTAQLGCATLPACPAKGGPAWLELTSDHFVMRTDMEEPAALVVLRRMEDARAAMLAMVWRHAPDPAGRVQVFALASQEEVAFYTGPSFVALHLRTPPFPPTVLLSGAERASELVGNHELAHALSLQLLPLQPAWFAEGTAEYLSTIHREHGDHGAVVAGDAQVDDYVVVRVFGVVSLDTLLGPVPKTKDEQDRFYATSWMLVHYLINARPHQLDAFQARLAALEPAAKAFRAEFPDLAGGRLETVLKTYAFSGKYTVLTRPLPAWNGRYQSRRLSDAEVHASRAVIATMVGAGYAQGPGWVTAARADVAEALQDPRPPIEAFVLPFYEPRLAPGLSRAQLARRALEVHPEHWMAWWLAAEVADHGSTARYHAVERALQLNPLATDPLEAHAWDLALQSRWHETLAITNEILPDGALRHDVWVLHLEALMNTGHCREAALWGSALQGFLNRTEAREISGLLATGTCAQPIRPAPHASQAAGAHAGEGP